ncbi:2191_t:CDS:1, partial [Scutellospora calospora]
MINIKELPNEILITIFKELRDLKSLIVTCRQFYEIIIDPYFKVEWFHHNIFNISEIIQLGSIFFDKRVVEILKNNDKYIDGYGEYVVA